MFNGQRALKKSKSNLPEVTSNGPESCINLQKYVAVTRVELTDIGLLPAAFWAEKLQICAQVKFANSAGTAETREGKVQFIAGDAILTGVEGETWPIEREKFLATYEEKPPTIFGLDGEYVKRPMRVLCLKVNDTLEIPLDGERGTLRAEPGDYLIQYHPGDLGVVGETIFHKSYQVLS